MKFHFIILILASRIAWGGDSTPAWGPMTNNAKMSVTIKGGVSDIKTNQPFRLLFCVTNTSPTETFCVYRSNAPESGNLFSLVVISPSGKDISPRTSKFDGSGSGANISVEPQKSVELEFDLRKVCKLDEIGTYTVTAEREIWPLDGRLPFRVKSNRLRLTVVPGQWVGKEGTNASKHW